MKQITGYQPLSTQATTGFTVEQISDIEARIEPLTPMKTSWNGRAKSHSLFEQIVIALAYLRTNQTQAVLAETHHTSQPTISRIIVKMTKLFADTFGTEAPTGDDVNPEEALVIDGTLVPNWSWQAHPEDYSGKHHTTGRNLQVACSIDGQLRWISDDMPGSTHDSKAIRTHGLLERGGDFIGDKGYIGLGIHTPIRRQPGQDHLEDWQEEYNSHIESIRAVIERCNAHLKNWLILKNDYRRPWKTHSQTITAVIGLHFYRLSL